MKAQDRHLFNQLTRVAAKNMGKVFFSLFAIGILETINSMIFAGLSAFLSGKLADSPYKALSFIPLAAGLFVWFLIIGGFFVMLLRMARNEYVTLGFLLYGFRRFKTMAGPALFFTSIAVVLSLLGRMILHINFDSKEKVLAFIHQYLGNQGEFIIVVALVLLLFILISYIFIFTVHFKYDNPDQSVFWCASLSRRVIFLYFFKFIAFVIRSSARNLCLALFYAGMTVFTTAGNTGFLLQALALVFQFLYVINIFKAIGTAALCIPVFYQWAIEPKIEVIVDLLKQAADGEDK